DRTGGRLMKDVAVVAYCRTGNRRADRSASAWEMQRAISIVRAYGERLGSPNLKANTLDALIRDYPSHPPTPSLSAWRKRRTSLTSFKRLPVMRRAWQPASRRGCDQPVRPR